MGFYLWGDEKQLVGTGNINRFLEAVVCGEVGGYEHVSKLGSHWGRVGSSRRRNMKGG